MSDPVFCFENVAVEAAGHPILRGVDTVVPAIGVTALVGPSGSGKSTLLRLCNRLEVPTSGRVLFRGDDIGEIDPLVHRRRVGMVFQRPTLFAGTIRENLLVAEPEASPQRCSDVLDAVGLDASFLDRVGDDLSGGEAQRACLARTLITDPEVILMDEVTSSLDERNSSILERLACRLAGDGTPIVWVTHDPDQVRRIASHVISMRDGAVVAIDHPTPDPDHHSDEKADDEGHDAAG